MINKTDVGDAGLLVLAGIPSLTNIGARDRQVSAAGIEAALAVEGRNDRLQIRN